MKAMPLEYVHITKTAGTSIEMAAFRAGIEWGSCRYAKGISYPACAAHTPLDASPIVKRTWSCPSMCRNVSLHLRGTVYHAPPHYFASSPFVAGVALFTVVRHPFTRMVSEYYCPWKGSSSAHYNDSAKLLNAWLEERLQVLTDSSSSAVGCCGANTRAMLGEWDGHLLPQHLYVFHRGKKQVDHVLRYENLDTEFSLLMSSYGLHITLRSTKLNVPTRSTETRLTAHDLTARMLEVGRHFYRHDFLLLNYSASRF